MLSSRLPKPRARSSLPPSHSLDTTLPPLPLPCTSQTPPAWWPRPGPPPAQRTARRPDRGGRRCGKRADRRRSRFAGEERRGGRKAVGGRRFRNAGVSTRALWPPCLLTSFSALTTAWDASVRAASCTKRGGGGGRGAERWGAERTGADFDGRFSPTSLRRCLRSLEEEGAMAEGAVGCVLGFEKGVPGLSPGKLKM